MKGQTMSDQTKDIINRLRGITAKATRESERSLWRARLGSVGQNSDNHLDNMREILRAYQDGWKTGTLRMDPKTRFYIVAGCAQAIAESVCFNVDTKKSHPELEKISEKMKKVRKKHGLADDEFWGRGEGPEEYEALNAEYEAVSDNITADVFREYGEDEMAYLFINDREEYDRRYCEGMEDREAAKKLSALKAKYRKHRKMDKGTTPSC